MRILYIDHYAGSLFHGMEYRPYYLAREWTRLGHSVTVVAASYSHLRSKQPECGSSPRFETIDGVRYLWLPSPVYTGNGTGRVRNMLAFMSGLRKIPVFLRGESFDAVIASSTYPFDNGPARRLARLWGAVEVYEVHDLWPLSPQELGGYSRIHPFIVATQIAEDAAYRGTDAVVSLLPAAEPHMLERGLAPGKFHHIPNGIDLGEWETGSAGLPAEAATAIDAFRQGRFLVGYAGGHGLSNALDQLLDAASVVPEAGFVLLGKGPEKDRLRKRAAGQGNVLFLDPVPKREVPDFLSRMDALYIGWARSSLYRFGISPNKLFDYMMAGKPIVHAVEAANDPCAESGCGISVAPDDAASVAAAVRQILSIPADERKIMGAKGRKYVLDRHDYRVLAVSFLNVLENAIHTC